MVVALAGTAFAGKPGGSSSSIVVPDTTFGGISNATVAGGMWVYAQCFQNGDLVFGQYKKADASGAVVLGYFGPTPSWSAGSANCTAQEGSWSNNGRWRGSASTTFNVAG